MRTDPVSRVAAVVTHIVVVRVLVVCHVVVVDMLGAIRVQVNSAHGYASTSIETMRNSSPLSNVTSKLSQVPHTRIGSVQRGLRAALLDI